MKYIYMLFVLLSLNCCASESGVTISNDSGHIVTVYYKTIEQRRHVEILHEKYATISMRRPCVEKPESLYFHWKYQPTNGEIVERQEKITLTEPVHRFTLAPAIVIAAEEKKFGLLTDKTYSKPSDDRD